MLGMFLWNQIVYRMDMLFLIIPLTMIGLWLFCGIFPETYRFAEEELQITHKFRKTIMVSYTSIFNYDAVSQDGFINLLRSNRVKVYYTQGKKRRVIACTPRDVEGFVEALKANCSEFDIPEHENSRLAVFFDSNQDMQLEKEIHDE